MRKLTEVDKQEILKLYRETMETTSTLAEKFEVSNSTISRLLKSTLAEDEYEYLVSLKRAARTPEGRAQVSYDKIPVFEPETNGQPTGSQESSPKTAVTEPEAEDKAKLTEEKPTKSKPKPVTKSTSTPVTRRRKRRSSAADEFDEENEQQEVAQQLELLPSQSKFVAEEEDNITDSIATDIQEKNISFMDIFGDDELDLDDDLDDIDDDLDDIDDEDDLDDEEDDTWEPTKPFLNRRSGDSSVQVLPLAAANLPRTCYLVIDRAAELITRPLRDFGDLGYIPNPEIQQRTLPIFDNHRVAKRFSSKRDRIIKVPDSRMIHKARYHLQAKGITRLLIDGQIYSLVAQ